MHSLDKGNESITIENHPNSQHFFMRCSKDGHYLIHSHSDWCSGIEECHELASITISPLKAMHFVVVMA